MIRLINMETLKLETFSGKKVPKYAILSHTWGTDSEELTFDDLRKGITDKPGIGTIKFKGCCDLVIKENIKEEKENKMKHVWIDTCCIDKSSSSELQEAINAMFDWYANASVCYAYLSDVPQDDKLPSDSESKFFTSRWFSRGWTLQELLAPKEVRFYNAEWKPIGDKIELSRTIEKITGISWLVLKGIDKIHNASVAQRMSWAARRETTRPEDLAYCLLGIFDIHMSMLYPEGGKNAFFRLQDLIMKKTGDDSILAWDHSEPPNPQDRTIGDEIFAVSPAYFANSGKIVARKPERIFSEINVLGGRLGINLPLHIAESGELFGLLNCGPKSTKEGIQCVGIPLAKATSGAPNEYIRPKKRSLRLCPAPAPDSSTQWIQIKKDGQKDTTADQQCWLYEDASFAKFHLELMEVHPSSWWDKKKGMISGMDSDDTAINRILMRCRYCKPESKTEYPDFLFILELSQPGSNAKHLFHTAICRRDAPLPELAEQFRPELPNISGYASNGIFNLHITLDSEDGGDRMSLTPGEAPDSHDTINASSETEKLAAVAQFTKLLRSRKLGKAKEERLRIDTEARRRRLQFVKEQRQTVDDEIKKLEARRAMLIEEEQDKSNEMNDLAEEQTQARKLQDDLFKELEAAHQRLRSVEPIEYSEVKLNDFDVDENDSEAQRKDEDVGRTLLREAIKNGDVEAMKMLLAGSDDEDAASNYSWLVLTSASFRGDADTVGGLLANNKVDPDSRDIRAGRTALGWASENGHADVVKLLLDTNRVNVNAQDVNGATPLHLASGRGHTSVMKLLVDRNDTDLNPRDVNGKTPLQWASEGDWGDARQLLLDRGAPNVYQQTLQGYGGSIEGVAFSHDSALIASGSSDYTVRILDRITGRWQKTLEGHNGIVNAVAFSHDSTLIASASNDSAIRVWNTTTGRCQQMLRGPRSDITMEAVAFSHDSKLIISGSSDAIFKVWDVTTGKLSRSLMGHNATIYAVAFSHNSYLMISASRDGVVIMWNDDKRTYRMIEPNTASLSRLNISEMSMYFCHFCTTSADGAVRVGSTENGQRQQISHDHDASPTLSVIVASGSLNETRKLWGLGTRICKQLIGSKGAAVRAIAFSHDLNFVVCGLSDGTIQIWDKWLSSYASNENSRHSEEQSEERHLELRDQ
ncbi:uncharacterized protein Triagg1_9648 [Trichoderma aggressivum f. europaeum]|uniref:Heterokaryon incompatibility domain-containing protein n=1 Tax=Trichoderma aggressivum f. europaeum TaxID=173218 RepID=A0AAE1J1K9_9HYPO|nr:hypothetical protein Triagg1_9648 [Trichoderma aggressivum f. europaeum]